MTAARRGETLALIWDYVDFAAQTAFLPITKNGRSRKLPLRSDLLDLLEQLPKTDARVFPFSTDTLAGAWQRICMTSGIADLLVHDLGHEAISRVAEVGDGMPGSGFGLVELQAFSGHRDPRMLLRYAHLCTSRMAARLDAAFANAPVHKGRRRPGRDSQVKLAELTNADMAADVTDRVQEPGTSVAQQPAAPTKKRGSKALGHAVPSPAQRDHTCAPLVRKSKTRALPDKVIPFPARRRTA